MGWGYRGKMASGEFKLLESLSVSTRCQRKALHTQIRPKAYHALLSSVHHARAENMSIKVET